MKKLALLLALLLMFTVVLCSCGEESGGLKVDASKKQDSNTITVTDLEGNRVTVSKNITKVASLSPSATKIIAALGLSDKLVGVDAVSAKYDGISATATDENSVAGLGAEIIFIPNTIDASKVAADGVIVFRIPTEPASLNEIKETVRLIGSALNTSSSAESLVTSMTNAFNVFQITTNSSDVKVSILVDMGNGKAFGSGTYMNEVIASVGATNALADKTGVVELTKDDIIAANPKFIFTAGSASDYLENPDYAEVNAVVNGYVYEINADAITYPTNTISTIAQAMNEGIESTTDNK